MDFAIIRFTDEEDAPGIVSTKWIDTRNNTCWYPNVRTEEKKNKLLVSHASPKKEWLNCPMRILRTFSSYQSARRHLREAEDTSNLETDSECIRPRKRKKKSFHFPGSSSEDESPSLLASIQQNEAYPPPPLSSSLTFSPPPATSSLISTPAVASFPSSNNEVLNNKMEKILNNQQNLWQLMEELLESNRRLEHKVDTFITHQQVQPIAQEEDEEMSFISLLPLGFEDFVKFDKKIAENSGFKKRLLNLFMTIGARDAKILVCNIMRKLMMDVVGEKYSLTGKSTVLTKLPFEKTEAYKLILEICFRNFKEVKLNVVREAMSDWLMQSKFRKSKREKRSETRSGENCTEMLLQM